MEIQVNEHDQWTVVSLGERVDALAFGGVKEELSSLLKAGKNHLLLDFTLVSFLSLPLIKYLSQMAKTLKNGGGQLVIIGLSEKLKRQMHIYATLDHISLYRSNAEWKSSQMDC